MQREDISNFSGGTRLRDEARGLARSFDSKGASQVVPASAGDLRDVSSPQDA